MTIVFNYRHVMDLQLSSSNTELNKSNTTIILHFKLLLEILVYRVYIFFRNSKKSY